MLGLDDWIADSPTGRRSGSSCSSRSCSASGTRPTRTTCRCDHARRRSKTRAPAAPASSGSPGARGTRRRSSPSACRSCSSNRYLPERVQQGAETAIGVVIVYLCRAAPDSLASGRFTRMRRRRRTCTCRRARASARTGSGSSTGWGEARSRRAHVASSSRRLARVLSLVLLAVFTAVSMAVLSTGFGAARERPVRAAFGGIAPALGVSSLAFGIWYATRGLERRTVSSEAA